MSTPDLRTAASLLEKGDYDGARNTLERLVDHDHVYVAAHVLLAKIAENQTRYPDAMVHWEKAYLINPMSSEISISYRIAVLRTLLPNPSAAPVREMNMVPPIEEIREGDAPAKDAPASVYSAALSDAPNTRTPVPDPVQRRVEPVDDLDRLIDELDSARLVPDPDVETISDAELKNDIDDVVSETLARIYASQNYFSEAADVYEKLAVQHPARKDEFVEKAADMFTRALARN